MFNANFFNTLNFVLYVLSILFVLIGIKLRYFRKSKIINTELDNLGIVVKEVIEQKNQAYKERNILVALLARIYPSGIRKTEIEGWSPEWHNCVYIELPDGSQCSWHYHDRDSYLFEDLPPYEKEWDGHTTENKYFNIEELILSGSLNKNESNISTS